MQKTVRLSEIAVIQSGYSFRGAVVNVEGGKLGVIQAKDINGWQVYEPGLSSINQEHSSGRLQQDGDILLTSRGSFRAGVGRFSRPAIASSSLFTIRLLSKDFLPEYLAIYLNSEAAQYYFSQSAKGATIQSLVVDDLKNLPIPHMPLENQKTVIDLQRNIDEQNGLLKRKQRIIDEVLRSSITRTIEGATK